MEAGFKYGLSAGSLSSTKTGTYNNGSISASLSGLTAGTTYFYQAYVAVKGTGDKENIQKTFYGTTKSFTTKWTYLSAYEVAASSAQESSRTLVDEAHGTAFLFDTNSSNEAPTQTTINAIETRTGFNFFSNVPDSIENTAEAESHSFWQ